MQITQIMPDGIILSQQVAEVFQSIKELENKNDPNRRDDLYGPYEIVWKKKVGLLPPPFI